MEMSRRCFAISIILLAATVSVSCRRDAGAQPAARSTVPVESPVLASVIESAIEQTGQTIYYDPAYVRLKCPGGDVPIERGVCTDVIIRAFRKGGVDLQKEVHEDMRSSFSAYPQLWGMKRPDPNIDHRRVPNLMKYFERKKCVIEITSNPRDYLPGDVVAWRLDNGLLHVGIVTNIKAEASENYAIVHNIGQGARLEDVLFAWKIIGHYRYFK